MDVLFFLSAAVAVLATVLVITGTNAVHSLLYLAVSLLAVAMVFVTLGAPFAAALEVIIYAGAIVVFLIFVVMMLNAGSDSILRERAWLRPSMWIGPGILCLILLGELVWVLLEVPQAGDAARPVPPEEVGAALFGPYIIGVELAALLLLAGIVAAFHLGREDDSEKIGEGESE